MAGNALDRLKTRILIFFSVTLKQFFDTRTRQGRTRAIYAVGIFVLLLFFVVSFGPSEGTQVTISTNARIQQVRVDGGGDCAVHTCMHRACKQRAKPGKAKQNLQACGGSATVQVHLRMQ